MKRLNLFLLAFAALGMVFTSCEPSEDAVGPSLQITSGETVEAAAGSSITIAWRADAGDANMSTFTILEGNTAITSDGITWNAYEIPTASNETYTSSVTVNITEATTFTLTVTDKDGLTASKTVTVTIGGSTTEEISTWTATLYNALWYASSEAKGAFFASATGTVYAQTGSGDVLSATEQSNTDFMYWYGGTTNSSIVAPNDATAVSKAGASKSWTTKNATKLKKVTVTDWSAVDATLISAIDLSSSVTIVSTLATGDFIAFETVGGKKGIIKITGLSGTSGSAADNASIEVKVIK